MSLPPDLSFEYEAYRQGYRYVAGIDEVGRGCLAGPVVAAAVILPVGLIIEGVDDSKKLTPAKRELLYKLISHNALTTGIGVIGNEDIDRINIFRATIKAMEMAVKCLNITPDCLLIDAVSLSDLHIPQRSIIKGDTLSISIASASIVAKVTRDRLMVQQHSLFPQYNFISHKGYGTKDHINRLRLYGPSVIHRRSFLKKICRSPIVDPAAFKNMEQPSTRTKGKLGEEMAVEYLKNHGYRVFEKNYKNPFGEIDVIAKEGNTIVFIEVKTRNTPSYGPPAAAVDLRKQQRIGKVAAGYITEKNLTDHPVRFDVVSICGGKVEVIKDAFDIQESFLW